MDLTREIIEKLQEILHLGLFTLGRNIVSIGTILFLIAAVCSLWWLTSILRTWLVNKFLNHDRLSLTLRKRLATTIRAVVFAVGLVLVVDISDLDVTAAQILSHVDELLNVSFIHIGKAPITLWTVIYVVGLWVALIIITNRIQNWFAERILSKTNIDLGMRHATAIILKYIIVSLGFVVILQSAGVDLSALTVMAGAVGLGLSFGLQNITSNLVSGLIVLLERPIKVGDRVEVAGVTGDVKRIALRATTICTNDNIEIIVPNSDFISSRVTNLSHSSREIRIGVPVGVAYGTNARLVEKLLMEVADANSSVLKEPRPRVLFEGFGESSLNFMLRVSTREFTTMPGILKSQLNFAILDKFEEHKIQIPFPQRDLHIKSSNIPMQTGNFAVSPQVNETPQLHS